MRKTKSVEIPQREIKPDVMYPLPSAMDTLGIGRAGMRSMRRAGLEVKYIAGRGFVMGSELIRVITTTGKETKNSQLKVVAS
ncbi:hypothetical protein ETAA8_06690 [Anatilimnocola aggregata]|uniref:Uncharacterized protein n=1 Tax=Anatilimnocola aggregata TaxID=2528021 RepID=A0A517Y5S8_9BACT|nr:hypothetical protein [Anatilimnocola aggregata]QDU25599.1 hypothetical protein ETAA8_06690 [Anatilimnocola aggregata]